MPTSPVATDLRFVRIPRIMQLLRTQPLPAEVLLPRLNGGLVADRLPGISLRTLQNDLAWMQEQFGHDLVEKVPRSTLVPAPPAEFSRNRWFYRIAGAEELIPVASELCFVTELEALALQTARAQLAAPPSPDAPRGARSDEGPLAGAIARLVTRLGLAGSDPRVPDIIGVNLSAPQPWEPRHALALLRAIRTGDAVTMRYLSLDKPEHEVIAQPVRLVLNDGEPYLWAWDAASRKLKTYKLARIATVATRPGLADLPRNLDSDVRAHLATAFRGVSSAGQRGRATIRFSAKAIPHVRQRRFGGAQLWTDLSDGGARVAFNTHGLDAVKHWILQFGAEAVVEEPAQLRTWIRDEARRMAAGYDAMDSRHG